MTELLEGRYPQPGPWWIVAVPFGSPPGAPPARPVLRCRCGMFVELTGYDVSASGVVSPEFCHKVCGWHTEICLRGYNFGRFEKETSK